MNNLVFDIGAHNGCDTAYYLHKGYRVVAVEANPILADALRAVNKAAIKAGSLIVEGVGVAAAAGQMEFWVCDDKSEWSSFNRENAMRRGYTHHAVTVSCVTLQDLIDRHGVPWFMKVDIEGNDRLVVEQLTPNSMPEYISVESYGGTKSISDLADKGYKHFKVVDQLSFCTIESPETFCQSCFGVCGIFVIDQIT